MPLIRPKVVCVFRRGGELLLIPGHDRVTDRPYYVPPGGGVEFGEHSSDAIRREVREELGAEINRPQLLSVLESVFSYNGLDEHEIVFVYSADFEDPALYRAERLSGVESNGVEFTAEWVELNTIGSHEGALFPEGLLGLLRARVERA